MKYVITLVSHSVYAVQSTDTHESLTSVVQRWREYRNKPVYQYTIPDCVKRLMAVEQILQEMGVLTWEDEDV